MKSAKFNSVEEYLASQDPAKERTLRSVIHLIPAQLPELEFMSIAVHAAMRLAVHDPFPFLPSCRIGVSLGGHQKSACL